MSNESLLNNPDLTTQTTEPTTQAATEFTPDPAKSAEENAAAKEAFDKTVAETKAKADADAAAKAKADEAAKANDTKVNPFKVEELKVPEGMTVDEATSKSFVELVNKFGIGRDAAAELVNLQASLAKSASEAGSKAWNDMQETWRKEVEADPALGGEKLKPALGAISKLVDQFGSPELRTAFDLTGAGNNPHVIRFLHKIASQLGEGNFVPGAPGGTQTSIANKIYDKT